LGKKGLSGGRFNTQPCTAEQTHDEYLRQVGETVLMNKRTSADMPFGGLGETIEKRTGGALLDRLRAACY
jgi:hypothetical protein